MRLQLRWSHLLSLLPLSPFYLKNDIGVETQPSDVQAKSHPHHSKRGVFESPLRFSLLQYFEKISPSVESWRSALQDEVHIMGCHVAGGPVTSFKIAIRLAAILDFTEN